MRVHQLIANLLTVTCPPHLFVFQTDINPNSATYNQTRWNDVGPQGECPANTYYNPDYSGNYYSQNCGGQTPQAYYVSIPPGMFSSTTSQTDANNQAQQYGQTQANTYGSCNPTVSCSFTASSGFTIYYGPINRTGTTVSFHCVFGYSGGSINWYNSNQVATISLDCRPTSTRTLTMSENGRSWEVTIFSSGGFYVRLLSGTPPGSSDTIALSNGSYNQ